MSATSDIMALMKGCGTEFNMSTVMQCVQELKAWQESEKQKLCENSTMDSLTNKMEDVLRSFDIPDNVQGIYSNFKITNYKYADLFSTQFKCILVYIQYFLIFSTI